ncbi:MAG: hypothetical protein H7039_08380 [Bryobacteraceae bacterium]|nr:hypothetical protein [Bryobacteraceae bacterium]
MNRSVVYKLIPGLLILALTVSAQSSQTQPGRVMGVVSEKQGSGAKVRTDAGEVYEIVFGPDTKFQRIAPGQTSLKDASTITASDIGSGDRVLARGTATDAKTIVANSVILMSRTDLAEKQQKERQDWQKRGISGTVTALEPAKKQITIRIPQLAAAEQLVTLTVSDNAPTRRYSADSVRFADAKQAALTDVKPGDQLRARGDKSEDGLTFKADEVVTGSFQTLAATVVSVVPDSNELLIKDLDTNKTLTVRVTPDSTLKRMPNLGGGPSGPPPGGNPGAPGGPGAGGPGRAAAGGPGGPGGPGGGMRMPDIGQMMERLPVTTLADVKPGETIIVASTKSTTNDKVTAITLLAGAERFVAMRRAMAAASGSNAGSRNSGGPGGNWSLGDMSMIPAP